MADTQSSVQVGSAAWRAADNYEDDDDYSVRAVKFEQTTKWDALKRRCSEMRKGISCKLREGYSIGQFNMVRHILYDDGVEQIARLRMPQLYENSVRERLSVRDIMRAEVAAMKFLKLKTSIPVPELYYWDLEEAITENDVGAPFMIMEYIHGNTADEMRDLLGIKYGTYGTPEQDAKYRQRIAEIQVELASWTFDKIGNLYMNPLCSHKFDVGPETSTGKGPWKSTTEYFEDLAEHALRLSKSEAPVEVEQHSSFANPIIFKHLMSKLEDPSRRHGPFPLCNEDFGSHNVLVNEEFEILAMIDFDGIMAAPIEQAAQFPGIMGLAQGIPGVVETRPLAIETYKEAEPKLKEYRELVKKAEDGLSNGRQPVRFSHLMTTRGADVMRSIEEYRYHRDFTNEGWQKSYVQILHELLRKGQ